MADDTSVPRADEATNAASRRLAAAFPVVYDFVARSLLDRDAAVDIAIQSLERTGQVVGAAPGESGFEAWLLFQAREVVLANAEPARPDAAPVDADWVAVDREGFSSIGLFERGGRDAAIVWEATGALDIRDAMLALLFLRHALRADQIGPALGVSPENARRQLLAVKQTLDAAIRSVAVARLGPTVCDTLRAAPIVPSGASALVPALRVKVDQHARECLTCSEGVRTAPVAAALRTLVRVPPPRDVSERIESSLANLRPTTGSVERPDGFETVRQYRQVISENPALLETPARPRRRLLAAAGAGLIGAGGIIAVIAATRGGGGVQSSDPTAQPAAATQSPSPTATAPPATPPKAGCVPGVTVAPTLVAISAASTTGALVLTDAGTGCLEPSSYVATSSIAFLRIRPLNGIVPLGGKTELIIDVGVSPPPAAPATGEIRIAMGSQQVVVPVRYDGGPTATPTPRRTATPRPGAR